MAVGFRLGVYVRASREAIASAFREGFDAVFSEPSREVAAEARDLGLLYASVLWLPQTDRLELGIIDAWGERRLFAFNNSGCLLNPALLEDSLARFESAVYDTMCDAVILDAVRYPSPHDGRLFYSCFCEHCCRFMEVLGVDPQALATQIKDCLLYTSPSPRD